MPANFKETPVAISTATTTTVIAAQTGKIIRVYGWLLANELAQDITFVSGSTALTGPIPLSDLASTAPERDDIPWFTCGLSEAFKITTSAASKLSGRVYYTVEG